MYIFHNSRRLPVAWLLSRGGLGEKSGPGVTVRPAHSIHGARPTQYTARCPLNTRGVAHSMHRTYRPVSDLLGKIPIHLTLFWKKLHHICFFFLSHLDTPICL